MASASTWQIFTKDNAPLNGTSGGVLIDSQNRVWVCKSQNDSLIAFEKGKWFEYSASDLRGDSSNLTGAFLDKKGAPYFNFSTATTNPYARSYSIIKYQDGLFQPAAVPANCSDFLRADQIIADTANNLLCNVIISSNMFSSTELGIFRVSASTCSSIVDFQKADSLIKIADSSIYVNTSTLAVAIAVDSNNTLWMTMLAGSDLYKQRFSPGINKLNSASVI
jgi:hypothetical protein